MNLVRRRPDLGSLRFWALVTVTLVDRLTKRRANPRLDVSLGNQNHRGIGGASLIQMATAFCDGVDIGINNDDEQGVCVRRVPPPASLKLLWELTQNPPKVSAADYTARISRKETWRFCIEAALRQVRAHQLLLRIVLA